MVATPGSFSVVKGLPVLLYYKPLFPRAYNFALLNQSARTWCTSLSIYTIFLTEEKKKDKIFKEPILEPCTKVRGTQIWVAGNAWIPLQLLKSPWVPLILDTSQSCIFVCNQLYFWLWTRRVALRATLLLEVISYESATCRISLLKGDALPRVLTHRLSMLKIGKV